MFLPHGFPGRLVSMLGRTGFGGVAFGRALTNGYGVRSMHESSCWPVYLAVSAPCHVVHQKRKNAVPFASRTAGTAIRSLEFAMHACLGWGRSPK